MQFNKIVISILVFLVTLMSLAKAYGSSTVFSLRRAGWGMTCWDMTIPSCKLINGWHDQGIHVEFMIELFPEDNASKIRIMLEGGEFMSKQPTLSVDGYDPVILEFVSLRKAQLTQKTALKLIKRTGELFLIHPVKIQSGRRIVVPITRLGLKDLLVRARAWLHMKRQAAN